MTKVYLIVDDAIAAVVGDSRQDLVLDPLGNVVASIDAHGNIEAEAAYGPFGEVSFEQGNQALGGGWLASLGYINVTEELTFAGARCYDSGTRNWMSVDPYWPLENSYTYAENRPTFFVDPSGLNPQRFDGLGLHLMDTPNRDTGVGGAVRCTPGWNNFIYKYCYECSKKFCHFCRENCHTYAWAYYRACNKPPTWDPTPTFGPYPGGPVAPLPDPLNSPKGPRPSKPPELRSWPPREPPVIVGLPSPSPPYVPQPNDCSYGIGEQPGRTVKDCYDCCRALFGSGLDYADCLDSCHRFHVQHPPAMAGIEEPALGKEVPPSPYEEKPPHYPEERGPRFPQRTGTTTRQRVPRSVVRGGSLRR